MGYRPSYAQEQSRARRWSGSRLERDTALRACVLERLRWGWSPEQVCGQLAREAGRTVISYESIYRFIYAQKARHKDHGWRQYLPEAKWKRGRRVRQRSSSVSFILERHSLAERPPAVADRQTFGHWEADLMQFGRSGAVVLVDGRPAAFEGSRAGREGHGAPPGAVAPEFRQTVTFDNGTEFGGIMNCTPWGSKHTTRRGRRGAWRMGSVGCVACGKTNLAQWGCCRGITIRRASASATRAHPKYSGVKCCTSNVNPPSRLRGNDEGTAYTHTGEPSPAWNGPQECVGAANF